MPSQKTTLYFILKTKLVILFLFTVVFKISAQQTTPDFSWGNTSFFNLNIGDSIRLNNGSIVLEKQQNQFNLIRVGNEKQWIKVSKQQLPVTIDGLRIYVADNKNVKALTCDNEVHGLLKKDVLIGVVDYEKTLLNFNEYIFPVSFNDGFLWSGLESSNMFAYTPGNQTPGKKIARSHPGIDIDMHDARGIEKHWLVAIENSTVEWVQKNKGPNNKQACVLLKSEANKNIYYLYDNLFDKNLEVKKGDRLIRGQIISTAWGDSIWGHVHLAVIYSDSIPSYKNRINNLVNFFPQLYELYNRQSFSFSKIFTKGSIYFGQPENLCGNQKNKEAFEEYIGKGWILDKWNKTNTVECISDNAKGNVRLKKVLFEKTAAESKNPNNWYQYEINVQNGVYRVRAKVGDIKLPSWQKVEFEGVTASTYSINAGQYKWTNEKIIKVTDRKLSVRIYVDPKNQKYAGISELVFQRAY